MEFGAWAFVVLGVIAALVGMAGGGRMLGGGGGIVAALPGLLIVFLGLFAVMMVQIGRATVDTAEMTGKLLKNSNEELKILKAEGGSQSASFQTSERQRPSLPISEAETGSDAPAGEKPMQPATKPALTASRYAPLEYEGRQIARSADGFHIEGQTFETLQDAKAYVLNSNG